MLARTLLCYLHRGAGVRGLGVGRLASKPNPKIQPPTGNDENDDDEETGVDTKDKEDGDAMLRDFQYSLRCQYMERARNLRVARLYIGIGCHFLIWFKCQLFYIMILF